MMYDPKYRNDKLMQELLKGNVLDQLLYAFDPGNFRQTPQPLPLYDPNPAPQAPSQGGAGGGSSYLDQLLAGTQQAPVAASVAAAPLQQILQEDPNKYRKITNDFEDRYGVAYSRKYGM
jgi:hypothetical protein